MLDQAGELPTARILFHTKESEEKDSKGFRDKHPQKIVDDHDGLEKSLFWTSVPFSTPRIEGTAGRIVSTDAAPLVKILYSSASPAKGVVFFAESEQD